MIAIAIAGALMTTFSERGSAPYDLGAYLGLGSLIILSFHVFYFARKRAPIAAHVPAFGPAAPFVAHLRVRLAAIGPDGANGATGALGAHRYFFIVGSEGFSARLREGATLPGVFDAEFLRPELALPKFPEGTAFRVHDGKRIVAEGSVTGIDVVPPGAQ